MRLPLVTARNLEFCQGMLKVMIERRSGMLAEVIHNPVELNIDNPNVQYRFLLTSEDEVNALVFGLALLVNTVRDAIATDTYSLSRFDRALVNVGTIYGTNKDP